MLDKHQELQFISRLSLVRQKRVPAGFNFECPFCNEGKSKGRKRRAYLLINNPRYNYVHFFCQNCSRSMSLRTVLKELNYSLFEDYLAAEKEDYIKRLKIGNIKRKKRESRISNWGNDIKFFSLDKNIFTPVLEVKKAHAYCKERKIPSIVVPRLYFAHEIKTNDYTYKNMLVFPFYKDENIYGYQARSIEEKTFFTQSQEGWKVYNIFNIDRNERVYIFESIIDSLYVVNSIAMLGSSLSDSQIKTLRIPVFVFDNDYKKDTFEKMEKYIKGGYRVVIWPEGIKEKDVNEMICNMTGPKEIQKKIAMNTFSGLEAVVKVRMMKMKKMRS